MHCRYRSHIYAIVCYYLQDGSGAISAQELLGVMRAMGQNPTEDEVFIIIIVITIMVIDIVITIIVIIIVIVMVIIVIIIIIFISMMMLLMIMMMGQNPTEDEVLPLINTIMIIEPN